MHLVFYLEIRALLVQVTNHVERAVCRAHVHGRVPLVILPVDVCTLGNSFLDLFELVIFAGLEEALIGLCHLLRLLLLVRLLRRRLLVAHRPRTPALSASRSDLLDC